MFDTGQETEKAGYANAFASRSEEVKGGIANIILETKPIFIEEISRKRDTYSRRVSRRHWLRLVRQYRLDKF